MARSTKPGLAHLIRRLKSVKAKDIMTREVVTTSESTQLADVAELFIKKRITGLPVVGKKGKLVGIITATDLFLLMDMIESGDVVEDGQVAVPNPTVKFAMSTEVIRIKKSTTLHEIISVMQYRNRRTLPVMEGARLVGVVGWRDVLKHFYAAVKELNL